MPNSDSAPIRLSDRILFALELAIEQGDLEISELLLTAIEKSMMRKNVRNDFVERRDYPLALDRAVAKLNLLRDREND